MRNLQAASSNLHHSHPEVKILTFRCMQTLPSASRIQGLSILRLLLGSFGFWSSHDIALYLALISGPSITSHSHAASVCCLNSFPFPTGYNYRMCTSNIQVILSYSDHLSKFHQQKHCRQRTRYSRRRSNILVSQIIGVERIQTHNRRFPVPNTSYASYWMQKPLSHKLI